MERAECKAKHTTSTISVVDRVAIGTHFVGPSGPCAERQKNRRAVLLLRQKRLSVHSAGCENALIGQQLHVLTCFP